MERGQAFLADDKVAKPGREAGLAPRTARTWASRLWLLIEEPNRDDAVESHPCIVRKDGTAAGYQIDRAR